MISENMEILVAKENEPLQTFDMLVDAKFKDGFAFIDPDGTFPVPALGVKYSCNGKEISVVEYGQMQVVDGKPQYRYLATYY